MTSPRAFPRCAECGAAYRLGSGRCWLCGGRLPQHESQEVLPGPQPGSYHGEIVEATVVAQETAATFSLSSLFLVLTLAAVAAGVFAAAPGLGVLFLVIATPALARTMVVSSRRKRLGVATTPAAKFLDFMQSAGVVVLILLCIVGSLGIAGFMACTGAFAGGLASNSTGKGPETGFILGGLAGGLIALAGVAPALWMAWKAMRGRG